MLDYIDEGTDTGQRIMSLLSASLGLGDAFMREHHCAEPLALVRLVRYPGSSSQMGIGDHTDYGFLTLLFQDARARVLAPGRRLDARSATP